MPAHGLRGTIAPASRSASVWTVEAGSVCQRIFLKGVDSEWLGDSDLATRSVKTGIEVRQGLYTSRGGGVNYVDGWVCGWFKGESDSDAVYLV